MSAKAKHTGRATVPLRMSKDLADAIKRAATKTGLPQAEIIRLAIAAGLEDLRRIDWDLPSLLSSVRDDPAAYRPNSPNTPTRGATKQARGSR